MTTSYITAIAKGFPLVQCHAIGDPYVYESIVWDGGEALPSKITLDQWIANNPTSAGVTLTRYQFRKLFTFSERVAVDNFNANPSISAANKAILSSIIKDLELSGEVQLYNPDVAAGVVFLEQIGLIASGRAQQILQNQEPT